MNPLSFKTLKHSSIHNLHQSKYSVSTSLSICELYFLFKLKGGSANIQSTLLFGIDLNNFQQSPFKIWLIGKK